MAAQTLTPETVNCPHCNVQARFVDDTVIYRGKSYGGKVYVCPNFPTCDTYVGVHRGTTKPKGTMANKELRDARMRAHAKFDPIWELSLELKKSQFAFQKEKFPERKQKHVSKSGVRNQWYAWLANELGIPVDQCHIAMFDVATCDRVVEICRLDKDYKPGETLTERVIRKAKELEQQANDR